MSVPCLVVFRVLYVAIAVALCLIAGGLLLFFLFPRTVNISSSQPTLHPTNIYLNVSAKPKFLFMTVTVRFHIDMILCRPGVSNSFWGAGHTARYHSVGGPHCF